MNPQTSFVEGVSEHGSISLRDFTAPYQAHSETSRAAAKEVSKELGYKQYQVLSFIRLQGGCTDNEIVTHFVNCGWSANTPRARRVELVARGLVVDSGRVRNKSTVWVLAQQQTGVAA